MQRFFPTRKYEKYDMPIEFRSLLHKIGETFEKNKTPAFEELGTIIRKSKDLRC